LSDGVVGEISHQHAEAGHARRLRQQRARREGGGNSRKNRAALHDGTAFLVRCLERFQAKWTPVRVTKKRQIENLELRLDSIETGL
jgi:hypothetical protein